MPSPSDFARSVSWVIEEETGGDPQGGYTNRPADRGGPTRWGISQRAHPDADIENLTRGDAVEIYRWHYWLKIGAHLLPNRLAFVLFDFAVNSGTGNARNAVRALQVMSGARPDGVVGPMTAAAVSRTLQASDDPNAAEIRLASKLVDRRVVLLARLVQRRRSQAEFLLGWWRRTLRVTVEIMKR